MKKKRVMKRRRVARVKVRRAKRVAVADPRKRTEVVKVTFPKSVAHFLQGVSDYSSIPVELIINSLLAVQVHAMREKR